nr:unnamed protein product [Callosobruchus analis]
MGLKGTGGDKQ